MKINFIKKQFKQLLDLVYLGEWTISASRTTDERDKEYDELSQYICSFVKAFGYDDFLTYDHKGNEYYVTREYEEQMDLPIIAYDNDTFWNELPGRLAKRDLSQDGENFHTKEDGLKRLFEIVEQYANEPEENGIKNLVIKEVSKQLLQNL